MSATVTVRRSADNQIIGYIDDTGHCQNPACRSAIAAGRKIHAIPFGFATTLPDYHFDTFDSAIDALLDAAANDPDGIAKRNAISAAITKGN